MKYLFTLFFVSLLFLSCKKEETIPSSDTDLTTTPGSTPPALKMAFRDTSGVDIFGENYIHRFGVGEMDLYCFQNSQKVSMTILYTYPAPEVWTYPRKDLGDRRYYFQLDYVDTDTVDLYWNVTDNILDSIHYNGKPYYFPGVDSVWVITKETILWE